MCRLTLRTCPVAMLLMSLIGRGGWLAYAVGVERFSDIRPAGPDPDFRQAATACDFGWYVAADYRRYVAVLVCSRFSVR